MKRAGIVFAVLAMLLVLSACDELPGDSLPVPTTDPSGFSAPESTAPSATEPPTSSETEPTTTGATQPPHTHYYKIISSTVTCTEDGYDTYHCSGCGDTYVGELTPAYGHQETVTKGTPPTKKEDGLTDGISCSRCKEVLVAQEVIPRIGSSGLTYEINEDGKTCSITGLGTCRDVVVYIPGQCDGYPVTGIADYAFENIIEEQNSLDSVQEFNLPNGLQSIGVSAFEFCFCMKKINLPEGLITIGDYAFAGCGLTEVVIPGSVTSVGLAAFNGCRMTSLTISNGVASISNTAFAGCTLTSVVIPESMTRLSAFLFMDCGELTSVTLPVSITYIAREAFTLCYALTTLTYEGTMEQWRAIEIDADWRIYSSLVEVVCSDGVITLEA